MIKKDFLSDQKTNLSRKITVVQDKHETHSIIPSIDVVPIPEGVSFIQASFFNHGSVALNGIRRAKISLGETVIVCGQGLIGQLALQLAKFSGASPLITIDLIPERLNISKENGANYVFNPLNSDLEKKIDEITKGRKAQIVIEATGNPKVIPQTFELASKEGRIVLLGSPQGNVEVDFYTEVHRQGISVIGAHQSTSPMIETTPNPWTKRNNQRHVLKLIKEAFLQARSLVIHEFQLDEAKKKAYEGLTNNKKKNS